MQGRHNPSKTAEDVQVTVQHFIVNGGDPRESASGASQLDAQLVSKYGEGLGNVLSAGGRLPPGWIAVDSQSRPGQKSYENASTILQNDLHSSNVLVLTK